MCWGLRVCNTRRAFGSPSSDVVLRSLPRGHMCSPRVFGVPVESKRSRTGPFVIRWKFRSFASGQSKIIRKRAQSTQGIRHSMESKFHLLAVSEASRKVISFRSRDTAMQPQLGWKLGHSASGFCTPVQSGLDSGFSTLCGQQVQSAQGTRHFVGGAPVG